MSAKKKRAARSAWVRETNAEKAHMCRWLLA